MEEYSFYRKKIKPTQMLRIIIKSWFTSPPLALGCLVIIFFMPFYFLAIFLQIIMFLPVFPIIVMVYLPLSLKLYSKPEKTWVFWMAAYAVCAILLSAIPILLFYQAEGIPLILGAFIILSGMCGMYTYFNLYNTNNMELQVKNKND